MGKGYWSIWTAALLFFAAFYTIMIPLPLYLTKIGLLDWQISINKLRIPLAAAGLFGTGFGAFFQFLPLLTERRLLGPAGLVYTVYGIGIILTRLTTGRILDRYNQGLMMMIAFLLLALGLSGLALVDSQMPLLVSVVIIAVGSGILHPLLIAIHVQRVPAGERGRASAVFYLGFDVGIGLGAWIFAPIFQWFGLNGLYLLAAISSVLGIVPSMSMEVASLRTDQTTIDS